MQKMKCSKQRFNKRLQQKRKLNNNWQITKIENNKSEKQLSITPNRDKRLLKSDSKKIFIYQRKKDNRDQKTIDIKFKKY